MTDSHIEITHHVGGTVAEVFAGFTRDLFEALSPSFPPARLIRYDGNAVGDFVVIELGVPPLTQEWVSEITAHEEGKDVCYFVDEGRALPWPLRRWRHVHWVKQAAPGRVAIVEDITYGTGGRVLDALLRPVLRAQFGARGKTYEEVFGEPS